MSLVLCGIYIAMLAVAVYGYFTNLEEIIGKQMILMILMMLTGVVGILNS
jgi:hypothetical protein